jgi:geranylgeranyl pyrophosphate synthase
MKAYTQKALKEVDQFPFEEEKKEIFKAFALQLMDRKL